MIFNPQLISFLTILLIICVPKGVHNYCDYDYKPIPTIRPVEEFDAADDVGALRMAMKDTDKDKTAIINILTNRSNAQRQKIMKKYFDDLNRDLIEDLRSELSIDLRDVIIDLMYSPTGYLSKEMNRALSSYPKDTNTITEIVVSRNNKREIEDLNSMYQLMYNRPLVGHVGAMYISPNYRKLVSLILTGSRQPRHHINPDQAKEQAKLLYLAGEGKRGTDEGIFNKIMAHESYKQLRLIFREYRKEFEKTIEQSLRDELSGDLLRIHLAIVDYAESPVTYFTKQLYRAMDGVGTDDATLMRILISRSEIDLENIKMEFERRYEKTLKSAIEEETYGYYRTTLLSILK